MKNKTRRIATLFLAALLLLSNQAVGLLRQWLDTQKKVKKRPGAH